MKQEVYVKEESFGPIASGFYDYRIEYEFEDVCVTGWPEKIVASSSSDSVEAVRNILKGAREIIRDLSKYLYITFEDVYALNVSDDGWEDWSWDAAELPKVGSGRLANRVYPILRVENSGWKNRIFPEWNRDWMDETTHWRFTSINNSFDICARSVSGEWRDVSERRP